MRRFKLLCTLIAALILGSNAPAAKAEVVENYKESFETLLNYGGIKTPAGWLHGYYYNPEGYLSTGLPTTYWNNYISHETGGQDDGAYTEVIKGTYVYYYDNFPYDYLITPEYTGNASIYVKQRNTSGKIVFYSVTPNYSNNKWSYTVTKLNVTIPTLSTSEWVKVDLPEQTEMTRIGIYPFDVSIDDFTADKANLEYSSSLSVAYVDYPGEVSVEGDADGNIELSYKLKITNSGETTLTPGTDGYEITTYASNGYYGDQPIGTDGIYAIQETLAPSESAEITVNTKFNVGKENFTNKEVYAKSGIGDSKTKVISNLIYYAYSPMPFLKKGSSGELTDDIHFCVTEPDKEVSATYILGNNSNSCPMKVTSITMPEGYTTTLTTPITLAGKETVEMPITFKASAVGRHKGTLKMEVEDIDPYEANFLSSVIKAESWKESFEGEEIPVGYQISKFAIADLPEAVAGEGHMKGAASVNAEGFLVTPRLVVEEGDAIAISAIPTSSVAYMKVEFSQDRINWLNALSVTLGGNYHFTTNNTDGTQLMSHFTVTTDELPKGEWFVRITGKYVVIDEIYGYKLAPESVDLYLETLSLPATAMVNIPMEAKLRLTNFGKDLTAEDYKVEYVLADQTAATAEAIELKKGDSNEFAINYVPLKSGTYQSYVRVVAGESVFESALQEIVISAENHDLQDVLCKNSSGAYGYDPFNVGKQAVKTESLYTVEQITNDMPGLKAGNLITSVAWNARYSHSSYPDGFASYVKIYMGSTDATEIDGTFNNTENMVLVYDGEFTLPNTGYDYKFVQFDLTTPYLYDGKAIDVIIEYENKCDPLPSWPTVYHKGYRSYDSEGKNKSYSNSIAAGTEFESFPEQGYETYLPQLQLTTAAPVSTVTGKVKDSDSGEALNGASVRFVSEEGQVYQSETDEEGSYTITILQTVNKKYHVEAKANRHLDYVGEESAEYPALAEGEVHNVADILMVPAPVKVSGTVACEGTPLEGVKLVLKAVEGEYTAETYSLADGSFSLSAELPNHSYILTATAVGYYPVERTLAIEEDDYYAGAINMEQIEITISGTITGEGTALKGARVAIGEGDDMTSAYTDEEGAFSIKTKKISRELNISVTADKYLPYQGSVVVAMEDVALDPIDLEHVSVTVSGIVLGKENAPVEAAEVKLAPAEGEAMTATTDAEGKFTFSTKQLNTEFQLDITAAGYIDFSKDVSVAEADVDLGEISLTAKTGVEGVWNDGITVIAANGGAYVEAPVGTTLNVSTIEGYTLHSGCTTELRTFLPLVSGVYIVNGHKVMVK